MRFQLLGPLSITDGADTVVLQPSKPTILLATLLLHANSVVSAGYLQRTIWGHDQPATAKAALQTCVLRLRRLFARHGVTDTSIEAVPGGYRVTADPGTLDLLGFRTQVSEAVAQGTSRGGPERELYALKKALALWQGSLLANVPSDVLHRDEVPRLTEERLRTLERACDLELALGRCGEALVELRSATRAYPAHERFREQLIEALYRSGRQAEALAEYREIKTYLLDELGVDPSPALRRLELSILRGDDLGPVEGGAATLRPAPPDASFVAEVPAFTGRAADVAAMTARLTGDGGGEPVTLLVSGAPGIGKTALARHVAHLVRDHFPGGGVLVRMVHPDGTPLGSAEAAAEVAAALDRGGRDPDAGDADGRVLLVLDDVIDADQVRPLLPAAGDAACGAVIVTSRRGLAGLVATHGGWVHRLSTFDESESGQLLTSVLGAERVAAEPAAARRLAAVCGHHPLALRITTAWLLTRPGLGLGDAAEWLAEDPPARLSLADDPRMSVPRVLAAALDRLDPFTAEAFKRLGTLPGGGFRAADAEEAIGAAAAPLGRPAGGAEQVLERLADAGLLEDGPPGPYRMHPLLRAYARFTAAVPAVPAGTAVPAVPAVAAGAAVPAGTRPTQKV